MKKSTLFDIISPIMIGPSSSHTAGAVRLGLMAKNIYKNTSVTLKILIAFCDKYRPSFLYMCNCASISIVG